MSLTFHLKQCALHIREVQARHNNGGYQSEDGHRTVFDLLLESGLGMEGSHQNIDELVDEAFLLLFAGSDTTAYTLSCATYYILAHKDCLVKLRKELEIIPKGGIDAQDWNRIGRLPYLVSATASPLFGELGRGLRK